APSLLWASGAMFVVWFVFLLPLAIWVYTWVFSFASLWFTHYCLAALERLRASRPEPSSVAHQQEPYANPIVSSP
ncbi:MAG: hypothetical protein WCH44_15535, partial [Betaproteobacteria bacterium]